MSNLIRVTIEKDGALPPRPMRFSEKNSVQRRIPAKYDDRLSQKRFSSCQTANKLFESGV
jgi:hypothetical protein